MGIIARFFAKRGVKMFLGIGLAVGLAFGLWYISHLSGENERLEMQNSSLEARIEREEEIRDIIQEQYDKIQNFNRRLAENVRKSQKDVAALKASLEDIDFEKMAREEPDRLEATFNDFFAKELECIEKASGNANAECAEEVPLSDAIEEEQK